MNSTSKKSRLVYRDRHNFPESIGIYARESEDFEPIRGIKSLWLMHSVAEAMQGHNAWVERINEKAQMTSTFGRGKTRFLPANFGFPLKNFLKCQGRTIK